MFDFSGLKYVYATALVAPPAIACLAAVAVKKGASKLTTIFFNGWNTDKAANEKISNESIKTISEITGYASALATLVGSVFVGLYLLDRALPSRPFPA